MYKHTKYARRSRRPNNRSRRPKFEKKGFDPRAVIGKQYNLPQEVVYQPTHTFLDFHFDERLQKNIHAQKFEMPTPIQDQAIPKIINGDDVVGVANTGTGKTAAFLLPLIQKVVANKNERVLIVAPTRELALQINEELFHFSRGMGIYSAVCIGGASIRSQIRLLQQRPQFVVGTPGRILDLKDRNNLKLGEFGSVVLDEVDRMLDMGFIHDVNKIILSLPQERQSLFFSATLSDKVKKVMSSFTSNPTMISVKTTEVSRNVRQEIVDLNGRNKKDVLHELLSQEEMTKTLIFVRTKRGVDTLHKSLTTMGHKATVLHGNRSQSQRQKSLEQFRQGKVNIMIATDVASRGIDVDDISHVINHDLPENEEDYTHRIGRTGRADKKGVALSFVH